MMTTTSDLLYSADALKFDDPNKMVSTVSLFTDLTWRLNTNDPGYARGFTMVYWWPARADDESPTPQQLAIIDHMKRLAWVGLFHPALTFAKKVTALSPVAYGFASLLRFMTDLDLADFADLTPEVVEDFVQWTADDLRQREELRSGEAQVRGVAFQRLLPIVHIWKAREHLAAVGVPVPIEDPLQGLSALKVTRRICNVVNEPLPAIPDEVFLRIVNAATDVVLIHADDVLAAQNLWLKNTPGFGTIWSRMRAQEALAQFRCSTSGTSNTPWPRDLLDPLVNADGATPTYGLRRMITTLRDACVIVILATAGLRIREIVSINGGRTFDAGLPDCISSEVSSDGLLEMFNVTSRLTKGQILPLESFWLLGSRPNGIGQLPLAAHAVNILETLMAPWRVHSLDLEARGALMVNLPHAGLPQSGQEIRRITTNTLVNSLYDFYRTFSGLQHLPDVSADGTATDLRPIKTSLGRCILVRQYRKNYAQNLLRIDSGLLPAIQRQLHHMRMATTQLSYTGNDPRVLGSASSEQRMSSNRAIAGLLGMAEGNGAGGRLAELISSYEAARDLNDEGLSVEELAEMGLMLIPADHGWCGIQFAPHLSRCNGISNTASFLNRDPDLRHRNPSTCGGCPVFAFDRTHRPFWLNRVNANQEIWEKACAIGLQEDYRVAEKWMKQAANIIAKMDEGAVE